MKKDKSNIPSMMKSCWFIWMNLKIKNFFLIELYTDLDQEQWYGKAFPQKIKFILKAKLKNYPVKKVHLLYSMKDKYPCVMQNVYTIYVRLETNKKVYIYTLEWIVNNPENNSYPQNMYETMWINTSNGKWTYWGIYHKIKQPTIYSYI